MSKDSSMLVGLSHIRDALGMTQAELAEIVGISQKHLGRIESSRQNCSIEICKSLSKALNCQIEDLLETPTKVRLSELRLKFLRKKVAAEQERLEDLQVAAICGDDEEEAA